MMKNGEIFARAKRRMKRDKITNRKREFLSGIFFMMKNGKISACAKRRMKRDSITNRKREFLSGVFL
jgi:hypothetical protein